MSIRKLAAAALIGVAALGVSACATGLPAEVTRYSAMPAPQGQTFYVVPGAGVTLLTVTTGFALVGGTMVKFFHSLHS